MTMDLEIGSQRFSDVQVPVLWGTRAILQDKKGKLSVVDLSGQVARLEIIGNKPAPGVPYELTSGGLKILDSETRQGVYVFDPDTSVFTSLMDLPELQISSRSTRVGSNTFSGNTVMGYQVGLSVTPNGIALGTSLPPGLARLSLPKRARM
jgi:hypothetical protein